ncbi:MAG: DNA replication/repair protein RecF [Lutispora sp.]|nr:DNA replication/repair protein RecF [Lutispora sp.]
MNIESIFLLNYRNYSEQYIKLDPGINIFYGENAQGKTNIVEAVYLLTMGKSHRTQRYNEMVKWDENDSRICIKFKKDDFDYNIDFVMKRNQKKQIKVNGIRLEKLSDILGKLNTVIFSPDHMKIIKEGPSERRKFIDSILSQTKPKYYYNINQYLKVLAQRNMLLCNEKNIEVIEKTLDIWDHQLIEYGSKIIVDRQIFIDGIDKKAWKINKELSGGREDFHLKYMPSTGGGKYEINDIKKDFEKKLIDARAYDMRRKMTNYGPHRDELSLFINEKEVRNYGSQGQQRSALLSLKISEMDYIKDETGTTPVLLLDDVFSELDKNRQGFLISFIKNVQVIITCTEYENLYLGDKSKYKIFNVINGKVYDK